MEYWINLSLDDYFSIYHFIFTKRAHFVRTYSYYFDLDTVGLLFETIEK